MDGVVPAASWPQAQMLTPLQEEVASVIGALPEAQDFVLAGGAALISRGDVDRHTEDPRFLRARTYERGPSAGVGRTRAPRSWLRGCSRASVAGFARLSVERHGERTEVDLAADARLMAPELGPLGKTLAGEELAIDKVLAVFGRAEARDFLDLAAVEPRYGLAYPCSRATEKDPGFDRDVFADMLQRFGRLRREELEVDTAGYERLRGQIAAWSHEVIQRTLDRDSGLDRGAGDDLGIGF